MDYGFTDDREGSFCIPIPVYFFFFQFLNHRVSIVNGVSFSYGEERCYHGPHTLKAC